MFHIFQSFLWKYRRLYRILLRDRYVIYTFLHDVVRKASFGMERVANARFKTRGYDHTVRGVALRVCGTVRTCLIDFGKF